MDKTLGVETVAGVSDEDIVHLLNTKKQKSREILSITNAAADAVSTRGQKGVQPALGVHYSNQNYTENKENNMGSNISDSFVSTGSMDGSFSGQQRVRIPSRLLREIKSPLDRSSSGNATSSESKDTSSGSLFASQSSSEHSSIQVTGPIPTVVKYSSQPLAQLEPSPPHSKTNKRNDTPVVIKYLQEYTSSDSKDSTLNDSKSTKSQQEPKSKEDLSISIESHVEADSNRHVLPSTISEKSTKTSVEIASQNKREVVVSKSKNVCAGQSENSHGRGVGLCQGAPSSNLSFVHGESERGQVKAVSFNSSDKGKATRDMLARRQDHGIAVRRIVQPKIIDENPGRGERRLSQTVENPSKEKSGDNVHGRISSSEKTAQFPTGFEEQMRNLVSSLGAIESQCQENRAWQEKQQQELEQSIKQRDERRLQHLEEMQKQLVEYQLKYAQPITAPPHQTYTSTIGSGNTQGPSTTHVSHAAPTTYQAMPHHSLQASSGQVAGETLTQGVSGANLSYTPAVQHQTQPSFKTTVYGKQREENPKSGVKRKFVRNTRTQTSPQVSSSSSETSSPLDTPLPRKRHPVPMTRDWKADRGKKHVHFDTPDNTNPGKSSKKKVDLRPVARGSQVDEQQMPEPWNLQSSHELYARQRPLMPQRSPEADYIVNDISRLRKELRDALNETEQTKQSLKNLDHRIHSQISSSDESIVALPDHSRPYPLDAYLRATRVVPEELSTPKIEEDDSKTDPKGEMAKEKPGLCAHALSVLRDVQKQKDNLEWNLLALSRRHDEQYLYDLVEEDEASNEALRIRKDVAKKIVEIDAVVQAELLHEEQQRALENQVSVERSKPAKRPTHGVPVSTEKRAKLRNVGKENTQSRIKTTAKPKASKPPTKTSLKQPPPKRPSEDVTYTSRVYGRPDHVARRTTVKPEQARHQSSRAIKPSKSVATSRLDESSSTTSSEDYRPPSTRRVTKPRYYFHPDGGADQSVIDAHFKDNPGPLPGQLLPMAIPLGKPRKDPALRLPLCIDEEGPRAETVTVVSDVRQPNVAVITLKDEDCRQDSDIRKQKKSVPKKKRVHLERQILPNVDIDSSAVSDISSDVSHKATVDEPTILPIPEPGPDASEYEEFKDFEHVRTLGDDQESEESSLRGEGSVISLHGEIRTDKPSYQGPAFPPRNIQRNEQEPGGFQGNVGDLRTPSETVELKARELIEQELLARVVSEMAPPPSDPTSRMRRSPSPQSLAESSDTEPNVAAAIGLRGLQLFVDAGIPVDTELVRDLITEVLQEKVATMLGYPKPEEKIAPPAQEPEDDYTEPESGSEDYSRVQTPVRTPSAASQPESRPLSHVSTPDQTEIPDSISSSTPDDEKVDNVVTSGHVVPDRLSEEIEEGPLDDSVHKSPIATPVATPSPPHSVTSLPTPDVSEQEKAESEEKSPVETPEITESIRDKTPTESPQEPEEDDLKEQTLIEDDAVEEDHEPGVDIPVIKFELEPEPSEPKITNSPSSITTTTYSTQSTMGTVATDDEISEGEQLQPYVHAGQYSEGEFVAPSGITGNMTTLHEIPDDIFDSFNTSNKHPDLVKQAVHGLLKLDDVSDESTQASEDNTNSEGQRRLPSIGVLVPPSVVQDERSEGEVTGDVVSTLLTRIRQSVWRGRPSRAGDAASVGEVEERATQPFLQGPLGQDEEDLSLGEFPAQDRDVANIEPLPMQTLDRPSLLDSDENNNDSQRSSSISEVANQTWDTNVIMVTPKKASGPFEQDKPHPSTSYSEQSPPANLEPDTTFSRVVHVAEARHVNTPTAFFSTPGRGESESNDNVTMETLSEIDIGSRGSHVSDHVIDQLSDMSNNVTPKQVAPDQRARIQLTLPSAEPSASVSLISEGVLGSDDSAGEISSISSGEI